jgi:hypothetical protein
MKDKGVTGGRTIFLKCTNMRATEKRKKKRKKGKWNKSSIDDMTSSKG